MKKFLYLYMELAVPVWHSGLTVKLSSDIERVQRVAVSIMVENTPYDRACTILGLKPTYIRRQELCERFAVKTAEDKCRHNDLFQLQNNRTRGENKFREHLCKKSRFFKSPLPFLTRTLNEM